MKRAREEKGQAMVEFVLILPIFLGLVFLAIGFGITLNNYVRVTDVARVAARAAAIARFSGQPTNCPTLPPLAVNAANQAASGLTFTQTPSCVCSPDPSCTPGNGNAIAVTVKVDSQNALTTIPFLSIALPTTLTSTATVLLQ